MCRERRVSAQDVCWFSGNATLGGWCDGARDVRGNAPGDSSVFLFWRSRHEGRHRVFCGRPRSAHTSPWRRIDRGASVHHSSVGDPLRHLHAANAAEPARTPAVSRASRFSSPTPAHRMGSTGSILRELPNAPSPTGDPKTAEGSVPIHWDFVADPLGFGQDPVRACAVRSSDNAPRVSDLRLLGIKEN